MNQTPSKKSVFQLLFILIICLSYLCASLYFVFLKNTATSYSITRNWDEYYPLDNWNMPHSARLDLDGDGIQDFITHDSCAFVSSAKNTEFSETNHCEKTMQIVDNKMYEHPTSKNIENIVDESIFGQKISQKQAKTPFISQSFLAKTENSPYRFYVFSGFSVQIFELNSNGTFVSIPAHIFDYIDAIFFQISHVILLPIFALNLR